MPSDVEHQQKYAECRRLLDGPPAMSGLSEPWAATMAFYAAAHLVERLAADEGLHHIRHTGNPSRNAYLLWHPTHSAIAGDFMALFSASMVARYESLARFAAAYPSGVTQSQLIDVNLVAIEQYLRTALP